MTCSKVFGALMALAVTVGTVRAQTTVTNMFNGLNKTIPDGQLTGVSDTETLSFADPYFASITDVKVVLDINGGFNGDYYAYLVHDGQIAVLLNRVGRTSSDSVGYADSGMSITLSATGNDVHDYQAFSPSFSGGQLTGTWAQDGRDTDPQTALDTDARTSLLSSMDDLNPNGTWTLFLADVDFGQQGALVNWGLVITAIPEPSTISLAGLGGLALGIRYWRRRGCKRS